MAEMARRADGVMIAAMTAEPDDGSAQELDAIFEAAGRVAAASARLEWVLVDLHEALLQSPRAHVAVAGEGFDAARKACLALARSADLDPAIGAEIEDAVKRAMQVWETRGRVIHGVWLAALNAQLPHDTRLSMRMRTSGLDVQQWTVPSLRALAADLAGAAETVSQLADRLCRK